MKCFLSWCSAAMLLLLPACSDDKPAPSPGDGPGSRNGAQSRSTNRQSSPRRKPSRPVRVDMVLAKALWGMQPTVPEDVDNPGTPEMVALGRALYHDKRLSAGNDISCASCHDLANYGQDNKPVSPGTGGQLGERNTPTTWNAFRNYAQNWDYRAPNVEAQSRMHLVSPIEHGFASEDEVVVRIGEHQDLVDAFGKAFPGDDPITVENLGLAIGAFERTLVTRSRFDEFLDGKTTALTNAEKQGLKDFMEVGCQTCHMSRLLGGSMPQKLGVHRPRATEDTGRHKVTGEDIDKYFFKVPSLLNVEKTAPYGHDGEVETLEKAVELMADIQLDKKLTGEQVASIVAFLKSLTGELPADVLSALPKQQ